MSPDHKISDFLVSEKDEQNFAHLKNIITDENRPTLAFVGAGMSRPLGYRLWRDLVSNLAEGVDLSLDGDEADDLIRISDAVFEKYKTRYPTTFESQFRKGIRRALGGPSEPTCHRSHELLLQAGFQIIVTTNFDPCLQFASHTASTGNWRVEGYQGRSLPVFVPQKCIYHIHGRLWNEDGTDPGDEIVFLSRQYNTAYGPSDKPGPVAEFLKLVLRDCNVVFVGFSGKDPGFLKLEDQINRYFGHKLLTKMRKSPDASLAGGEVPEWFRLEGLPDSDEGPSEEGELQHAKDKHYRLIHYKYTGEADERQDWGLYRILEDLAGSGKPTTGTALPHIPTTPRIDSEIMTTSTVVKLPGRGLTTVPAGDEPPLEVQDFDKVLSDIEEVIATSNATKDQIKWLFSVLVEPSALDYAIQLIISDATLVERWVVPFFGGGFLTPPIDTEEPGKSEPYWYGGALVNSAARSNLLIIQVVMESIPWAGWNATLQLIRSYLAIDDVKLLARLAPTAAEWVNWWPDLYFDAPDMGSKILVLLNSGHRSEAGHLLKVLLGFKKSSDRSAMGSAPQSNVREFWLHWLIENHLPQIAQVDAGLAVECLESIIRQVVMSNFSGNLQYAPPALIPSPTIIRTIEEMGNNNHDPYPEQLTAGLRVNLGLLIDQDVDHAITLVKRYLSDRVLVFRRIALFLLSQQNALPSSLYAEAVRRENLSNLDVQYEYWTFVNVRFKDLPNEEQQRLEDWILAL